MATGEGAEELIVEVVAVGEHYDGWVCHRRMQDHAACVEGHRQTLARSLRMPHHTDSPIPGFATRLVASLVVA